MGDLLEKGSWGYMKGALRNIRFFNKKTICLPEPQFSLHDARN